MNGKQLSLRSIVRKHYWLFILLGMTAAVGLYNLIPAVYAVDDYETTIDSFNSFLKGIGPTMFFMMEKVYTSFASFLNEDGLTTAVSGFVTGIAAFLIMLYTCINVIKETQRGEIDMNYWFKIFASTAVAVLVVTSTNTIMNSLYDLGDLAITQVGTSLESHFAEGGAGSESEYVLPTSEGSFVDVDDPEVVNKFISALQQIPGAEDANIILGDDRELSETLHYKMQNVAKLLKLLNYAVMLPALLAAILVFMGIFEIKIRQMFAPIAVASIANDGARSSGVRFLKKYVGCFMKIAVYYAIAAIGVMLTYFFYRQFIASTDASQDLVLFAMMIFSNIAACMAMLQSGSLGDEIVGA